MRTIQQRKELKKLLDECSRAYRKIDKMIIEIKGLKSELRKVKKLTKN